VGAKQVDERGREVVEIGARMRGMLEEIEKAHIYISDAQRQDYREGRSAGEARATERRTCERLARIEAMLSDSKTDKK